MDKSISPPNGTTTVDKLYHYLTHFCNSPQVFKKLNPNPSEGIIYQIRPAMKNLQDAQTLYDLVVELAIYEKMADQVKLTMQDMYNNIINPTAPLFYLIAEAIETKDSQTSIKSVGYSIGYLGYSTWRSFYLYVEDIYVTEKYRGKKIGLSFIYLNMIAAHHSGIPFLRWQVIDWNTPSIEFYKSLGSEIDTVWYNCNFYNNNFQKFLDSYESD